MAEIDKLKNFFGNFTKKIEKHIVYKLMFEKAHALRCGL